MHAPVTRWRRPPAAAAWAAGPDDRAVRPRRTIEWVVAAVILAPLGPWLAVGSVADRFSGTAALKSVANLAAFFGLAAWAANLVLASRARPVERAAGGLEHLYRVHRRVGVLVVALAAVHAAFLTLHAGDGALDLWLPAAGWQAFTGVVALALLVAFVAASLAGRLAYAAFLRVQRLLGVAFLLGALHAIAVRGTAAASPALTAYLALLTAAGAASLAYRVAGGRLGLGRHRYRVGDVRHLDDGVVEIRLAPAGRPLAFAPGQFAYATFEQEGIPREAHPFTIASAPGDEVLRLAVKRLGDFTAALMDLRTGAGARLEGPFGAFCPRRDLAAPQTWIAGGIGITPFLSWVRSLDAPPAADLYYCTPGPEHAHFLDELHAIADRHPALRVIPVRKRSLGHLTVADLEAVNPGVALGHVFICGPPVLVGNLTRGLVARGVPPARIHAEAFDFR